MLKNFKIEKELDENNQEKKAESTGLQSLSHRERFGTIRYELFEHAFEKGLWADFKQNDDGT